MEAIPAYSNTRTLRVNSCRVENIMPMTWNKSTPVDSINIQAPIMKKLDTEQEPGSEIYLMVPKPPIKKNSLFIQRITELIEANLEDELYGITQLCKDFGISRAQLHRNLIADTGLSASKYIRSIRLRKALELLVSSDLNVSQVAYEVGFKDPKYFSRLFTNEFKESPRDFRKKLIA